MSEPSCFSTVFFSFHRGSGSLGSKKFCSEPTPSEKGAQNENEKKKKEQKKKKEKTHIHSI